MHAKRRVDAFNARNEVEHESDDDYSESELVGGDESVDPVAALLIAQGHSHFCNCQHAAGPAFSLPLFLRSAARLHRVSQVSRHRGNCERSRASFSSLFVKEAVHVDGRGPV